MHRFTPLGLVAALARRTWVLTTVTVVTCAALAAHAATAIVAADHVLPGPSPPQRAAGADVRSRPRPERLHLLERNIFCSSCGPTAVTPEGAAAAGLLPAVLIATELARTERSPEHRASARGSGNSEASGRADYDVLGGRMKYGLPAAIEDRATVRVVGTDVQGSWGVGDAIPGLGRLERIGPMWIEVVDGSGHRGRLSLLDAAAGDAATPAAGAAAPTAGSAPAESRWARRLTRLSEQDYEVDRALVRELVSAGGQPGAVPMIPVFDNGEIKGMRVGRVRPDSIQDALGLKTGDVLAAINGAPVKTLDQLLDLYSRLDQLGTLELSGTRSGKPLVRNLRLR